MSHISPHPEFVDIIVTEYIFTKFVSILIAFDSLLFIDRNDLLVLKYSLDDLLLKSRLITQLLLSNPLDISKCVFIAFVFLDLVFFERWVNMFLHYEILQTPPEVCEVLFPVYFGSV